MGDNYYMLICVGIFIASWALSILIDIDRRRK